ncbi:MAG: hypothetical protein LUE93_12510 [Bacteroides sp.]|nr:hypothetical protein [Bacteroides sp.]
MNFFPLFCLFPLPGVTDTVLVMIRLENPPKSNDPVSMERGIENQIRYIKEQNLLLPASRRQQSYYYAFTGYSS